MNLHLDCVNVIDRCGEWWETYLYIRMLRSSPETHLAQHALFGYSESSHLPSNNNVFHCRAAADAVFLSYPLLAPPLSLSPLSPSLFLLSLSLSLTLSQIDSPFPSAALPQLVMRIVSEIFRWMEPLADGEGTLHSAAGALNIELYLFTQILFYF